MKFEFEKQFGKGVDPWYAKAERWASKQRFPISFLVHGLVAYLKKIWIDAKIYNTMQDVDRQADELVQHWKTNEPERRPHIVEKGVLGEEGWSLEISNPIVEGRTSGSESGMVTGSDASGLQEDEGDKGTSVS